MFAVNSKYDCFSQQEVLQILTLLFSILIMLEVYCHSLFFGSSELEGPMLFMNKVILCQSSIETKQCRLSSLVSVSL